MSMVCPAIANSSAANSPSSPASSCEFLLIASGSSATEPFDLVQGAVPPTRFFVLPTAYEPGSDYHLIWPGRRPLVHNQASRSEGSSLPELVKTMD
ncbi:unnamed protein product [Linum trigynum]|uniref:Uncharacterized protein n=1 Tax=Linum trigynum TaxID=586398 RepID=A0AAV2CXC7_9ROSI